MKKMTLFTLFLSSIVMLSCSNQEQPSQEELTSVTDKTSAINAKVLEEQKYDYLYGTQVYYSSAEAEIKRLELQKTKLVTELENGNKGVMEQIENIQIQIGKLTRFNEYLISIKPPIGPGGPVKPQPCFDTKSNCIPTQNFTSKTAVVLGTDLIVSNVIIKNQKSQEVKIEYLPIKDSYGQPSFQIKSDFKGEGTMYTTFKTKDVGTITIPTPIIIQ